MCDDTAGRLTFDQVLTDPMVRLMMESDGVTPDELVSVLADAALAQAQARRWAESRPH